MNKIAKTKTGDAAAPDATPKEPESDLLDDDEDNYALGLAYDLLILRLLVAEPLPGLH